MGTKSVAELKAEMEAARERIRDCEAQQAELRAANMAFHAASRAYDDAADAERLAVLTSRLVGRTIASLEGLFSGHSPRTELRHKGIEVKELRIVLDDGTKIRAEDGESDEATFVVELGTLTAAVDPHAGSTGTPTTRDK